LIADRRLLAAVVVVAASVSAVGGVAQDRAQARPSQEGPTEDRSDTEDALVAIDVDVADGDAEAVADELDKIQDNVSLQLKQLSDAEAVVKAKMKVLANADLAISDTEGKIEGLTNASDSVVVNSFVNPPLDTAIESVTAESLEDSTVKQAILQMRADDDAAKLKKLTDSRAKLRVQKRKQVKAKAGAQRAREDAEAAVDDLKAAFTQRAQFVTQIQAWIDDPKGAAQRAGLSKEQVQHLEDARAQLAAKVKQSQDALAVVRAQQEIAAAAERKRIGGFQCPLDTTNLWFRNSWGEPRPGGRTHKGIDLMTPTGTHIVAPVAGRIVAYHNSTAGNGLYVYGDDGNKYLNAHLSQYVGGDRAVKAGELIGLVGATGDADVPHLHFQYHPDGGDPVNPYERLTQVCVNNPH
jgi:murein DD-endopeptidase MepM/ murein hydrolase activator NlpD